MGVPPSGPWVDLVKDVVRYDIGGIGPVKRLPNGYLQTTGRLTRAGVFDYRRKDGSTQRELRLPEEVFNADSLSSFALAPLTNGHPPEQLTAANTRRYQTGTIAGPRQDGNFMAADIQVTDEQTIKDAEAGKTELSNGYNCDIEDTSGVHPEFGRYDVIQRSIRGNHVALVSKARGGHDLTIRLDGDDARMVQDREPQPTPGLPGPSPRTDTMKTIRIDGVDYPAEEQLTQAIAKVMERHDAMAEKMVALNADVSKEKARADAAEESLEAEKKARADESSPEALQKRVDEAVEIQTLAGKILGDKKADGTAWKIDGMAPAEIKRAVVLHLAPDAAAVATKLDDGDDVYLQNRYDFALEAWNENGGKPQARSDGLDGVRRAAATGGGSTRTDAETSRAAMIERHRKLGTDPLPSARKN